MPDSLRSIPDLPSALERLDDVTRRLDEGPPVIFLDFDGTLAEFLPDPYAVQLLPGVRSVLRRLSSVCPVVVISGRELADVRDRVGVEGVAYSGSHGFDMTDRSGAPIGGECWARFDATLAAADAGLRAALDHVPGILVERKRFAISVHYRAVDASRAGEVREAVPRVMNGHRSLQTLCGRKIFDIRPDADWHKGKAVLAYLERLYPDTRRAVPLFIGDDVTDEDALRDVRDRGIGIVAGTADRPTAAIYSLTDPEQVRAFLEKLAAYLQGRHARGSGARVS